MRLKNLRLNLWRRREDHFPASTLCGDIAKPDFDAVIASLVTLSPKAMATFCYRLVAALPLRLVRTLHYYSLKRMRDEGSGRPDQTGPSVNGQGSKRNDRGAEMDDEW